MLNICSDITINRDNGIECDSFTNCHPVRVNQFEYYGIIEDMEINGDAVSFGFGVTRISMQLEGDKPQWLKNRQAVSISFGISGIKIEPLEFLPKCKGALGILEYNKDDADPC